jgi:hypothetical protein
VTLGVPLLPLAPIRAARRTYGPEKGSKSTAHCAQNRNIGETAAMHFEHAPEQSGIIDLISATTEKGRSDTKTQDNNYYSEVGS